jgi:hypothetical protein
MDSRTISLTGCGASGAYASGPDEEENGLTMTFFHIIDNALYRNDIPLELQEILIEKLLKNQSVSSACAVEYIHNIKIVV